MISPLSILAVHAVLPRPRPVHELVGEAGGTMDGYTGWDCIRVAGPDDHPGALATAAVRGALADAHLTAADLSFVVSVGVSRDFPPSWSMSTEVMRQLGATPSCLGVDLTLGCLATLVALNMASGWLASTGGGVAAVVAAERWSQTIDRSSLAVRPMWGHSDGASAILVRLGEVPGALATYRGAVFHSHAEWNDLITVKYGGTRFPEPPPGEGARRVLKADIEPKQIAATYEANYQAAFARFEATFGVAPTRLACNQISPNFVEMIARTARVPLDSTSRLGHSTGHVGSSDLALGLRDLIDRGMLDGPVALGASAPYACGFGLVTPAVSAT